MNTELKEAFELANNCDKFINEVFSSIKKENASSGYYAQNASSGDYAKNASSGYSAQNASSGDYAKNASSGNYAKNASSGYYAKNASSGYSAQNASSGYYAQNASSGDYAKNASSGYSAKNTSTGKKSINADIGYWSITKSKIGSWITLAEYRKNKDDIYEVYYVKTEYVDGVNIKEDIFYCLWNKKFREVIEIDGIKSAIIKKKNNIYKVVNFYQEKETYLIEINGVYTHGDTLKQARESLDYKLANRDTSIYKDMTLDTILTFKEAIQMYRCITGACESGCKMFVEQNNIENKKYSIKQIIELTDGQHGNDKIIEFFNKENLNEK